MIPVPSAQPDSGRVVGDEFESCDEHSHATFAEARESAARSRARYEALYSGAQHGAECPPVDVLTTEPVREGWVRVVGRG